MNLPKCRWALIFLVACVTPDKSGVLLNYLGETFRSSHNGLPSAIVVITEDGCSACDSKFADLMRSRTECQRCLFIIRAQGMSVDMNGFLDEKENLRFDDGSFKRLGILEASGVILMKDKSIDRVIPLERAHMGEQLTRFEAILDSIDAGPDR